MAHRWIVLFGILIFLSASAGRAQEGRALRDEARSQMGEQLSVALLTVGPGAAAYELFGHDAIIIRDQRTGRGWAFNFGVFDFEQEHFYWNFVQGRLQYQMAAFDADAMIEAYEQDDRSMWLQELNLRPSQRYELFEYLRNWVGRQYLYDYYLNNCSTQIRDALDIPGVLDGALHAAAVRADETEKLSASFRWHTRRLTRGNVPLYWVLEMVLGSPTDRAITPWKEAFLPQELQKLVARVQVEDDTGRRVPLVNGEREIYRSGQFETPQEVPVYWGWFLLAGVVVGGILTGLGYGRSAWGGWGVGFNVVGVLWCFVMGVGGAICVWGWLFTDHWATRWNENVLFVNVLALGLAAVLPIRRRWGWARSAAKWLTGVIAAGALVGVAIALVTRGFQYNFDVMGLTVPVWLCLAWIVVREKRLVTGKKDARE